MQSADTCAPVYLAQRRQVH